MIAPRLPYPIKGVFSIIQSALTETYILLIHPREGGVPSNNKGFVDDYGGRVSLIKPSRALSYLDQSRLNCYSQRTQVCANWRQDTS